MSATHPSPAVTPDPQRYKTIVIDQPWPGPSEARSLKGGRNVVIPYQTMTGIQIAELCDGPRIDIFARQARPGFEAWGNEAPIAVAHGREHSERPT